MKPEDTSVLNIGGRQIVVNGGAPIKDCPVDFFEADLWAKSANDGKNKSEHPVWRWDCGFKLDFDGPVLTFRSRFYPPKTHYGDIWSGNLTVLLLGRELHKKSFTCKTLDQLRKEVDGYTDMFRAAILSHIMDLLPK